MRYGQNIPYASLRNSSHCSFCHSLVLFFQFSTNPVYQKAWSNIQAGGKWGSVATNDIGFAKVLEGKNVYLTTESEYSYQ